MSSTFFSTTPDTVLAAWETAGGVYWQRLGVAATQTVSPFTPPVVGRNPKHPVAVANAQGEVLLAWTEGTGWAKGGDIAWQRFDSSGKPLGGKGRAGGLPTWSSVAAFATPGNGFVLLY